MDESPTLVIVFMVAGGMTQLVGWFITLVHMFQNSKALGCLAFFIPLVALIYAFLNRDELGLALWLQVAGAIITVACSIYIVSQGAPALA